MLVSAYARTTARPIAGRLTGLFFVFFLLLGLAWSQQQLVPDDSAPEPLIPADVIITHARLYTANPNRASTWAEAVAVHDGRIEVLGTSDFVDLYRGPNTKVIDARGRFLMPGFTDCHVHFMEGALAMTRVDLHDANTVAEIQKRVKEYADAHPQEPWITGEGWSYPTFPPSGLPDKKILDQVVPDRPVYLVAFDGHTSWANSKALALAGITRKMFDPANGTIVRDQEGNATGALKESAGDLIEKNVPKPTREERIAALRRAMHEANKFGLVRVHSAGGDFEYLDLLDELRRQDELTLRFDVAYFLDPPALTPEILTTIEAARKKYDDDWISAHMVKMMLDGVVESHTAAMLEPYSDDPQQSGKLFWDPEKYKQTVLELDKHEFQILTHAIGDKAVRLALDAYEQAENTNHRVHPLDRVEHVETISAEDIPRFNKVEVVASMQPLHAYPDEDTLNIWARNVGPERAKRAWVWRSIRKTDGFVAFGSDWPVVTLNPWPGVQMAVTRQTTDGKPPEGFLPDERLKLFEALKGYTYGAAVAGRRSLEEGVIRPDALADLILLARDPFAVDPDQLGKVEVFMTMIAGKIVYAAPEWQKEQAEAVKP